MTGPSPIKLMILRGPQQRGQTRGSGFVHFLNQPGPGAPAAACELLAAVGIVLVAPLDTGQRRGCR